MSEERFDCIVVGAGPAGSAAAITLAQAGLEVLLIERGTRAGSKNMTGGRLYLHSLQKLLPDCWQDAPLERRVVRETITLMDSTSWAAVNYQEQEWNTAPYHSYTVLRGDLDRWMAQKAEEAGVLVATGVKVDDLLWEENQIIGVRAENDEIRADAVIAADGVNSLLAQKAGLRQEIKARHVATGVKELIALPQAIIEERFNLRGEEGTAQLFMGQCTKGVYGGGFLYTNKDSISLGLVVSPEEIVKAKLSIPDLLQDFKEHPAIACLIEGGNTIEYSAHLVPEGGLDMMPVLTGNGLVVVGDAAGLVLNRGYSIRGMDFAIYSGFAAAQAIVKAKEVNDYSATALNHYQKMLQDSFVLKDLSTFKRLPEYLVTNPQMFNKYPQMVCGLMHNVFQVNGEPAKHLIPTLKESLKANNISVLSLIRDGLKGGMAL